MVNLLKIIFAFTLSIRMVVANNPNTIKSVTPPALETTDPPNISPEIINELKDFQHLIPAATVDEIVAKHYLGDREFRTALKYLRSEEFTQLQRQLLTIPEVLSVLEFLHLTSENATTTRHMYATKTTVGETTIKAPFDAYDDDNRMGKMTTNTGTIIPNSHAIKKATLNNKGHREPKLQLMEKYNNGNYATVHDGVADDNATAVGGFVRILLLKNTELERRAFNAARDEDSNDENEHHRHHKYHQYAGHSNHHGSLGTFTEFVEEILQHLPHSAYQNMIKDKCKKNAKFAEFYKALRSPELKPLVDGIMKTPNTMKIIQTLNSYSVDVKSLEPIAFKVISWGPNI